MIPTILKKQQLAPWKIPLCRFTALLQSNYVVQNPPLLDLITQGHFLSQRWLQVYFIPGTRVD